MAVEKVLLLHGPMLSRGINPVTQNLYHDAEGREASRSTFNCDQTVIALAHVFRHHGYKIAYSGWADDTEWLESNRALFDYLVISDQNVLPSESIRNGKVLVNNKVKLYYGALAGLRLVKQHLGEDAIVFRLRSDVAVHQAHAMADMNRIARGSKMVLIEYLNVDNMFAVPDFMIMGEVAVLEAIYESLYTRGAEGNSYHLSSHVDHSFTYLAMQKAGVVGEVQCMSRASFDSVVWRGVPRYFEYMFPNFSKNLFFDGRLSVSPQLDLDQLIASIPPELSGKDQNPPKS